MSDKLNTLFPEATKIFSKTTSVDDEKSEIIFPNLDKIAESIEKAQTPKELQFIYRGENVEFDQNLYQFVLSNSSKK